MISVSRMNQCRRRKRKRRKTFRESTSSSHSGYTLLVVFGGNSNHVTTNCANPQLRNAQLPGNVVSLYACANFLRFLCGVCACVRSHVHSRACSCVNLSSYNTCLLPVKLELSETIQPVKTWNKFRAMLFHPTLL